jgi:hypothetical protein
MLTNVAGAHHRQGHLCPWRVLALAALLLAASAFLVAAGSRWRAARASRSWPETEGVVIESRLTSNCSCCWPTINYYYTVAGQSFVGNNITAGPQDYYNRDEADAKASLYTVGSKLAVHYDPKHPAVSCLEPGVLRWFTYLYLTFAGCLMSTGLFPFWRFKRSNPKVKKLVPPQGFEPRTNRL